MAPKSLFHKLTFFVGGTLIIAILILGHATIDKTVFSKSVISQRLQALKSHLTVFSDSYFGNASKGKHYIYFIRVSTTYLYNAMGCHQFCRESTAPTFLWDICSIIGRNELFVEIFTETIEHQWDPFCCSDKRRGFVSNDSQEIETCTLTFPLIYQILLCVF